MTSTVPTDIAPMHTARETRNFALRAGAWSLGLIGLLRLPWVEAHLVLPLTAWQALLAGSGGAAVQRVTVNLSCSGADAMALCVGVIAAYPSSWRARVGGALAGVALILTLNVVRIGTLAQAAASPRVFEILHLSVWPLLLVAGVAAYVFGWMRAADRDRLRGPAARETMVGALTSWRFAVLAGPLLVLFTLASPLYADSSAVRMVASFTAHGTATVLDVAGASATATASVLSTAHGAYLVTIECLATPLIPLYLAAVLSQRGHWPTRLVRLLLAVPLFQALAIARLLVVALPAAVVGSGMSLVHAFYQLVLAAVIVTLAAMWRHQDRASVWRHAVLGAALGGMTAALISAACRGDCSTTVVATTFTSAVLPDPQGALASLPAFQAGLYVALSVATLTPSVWRAFLGGLAVLALSQVVVFAALPVLTTLVPYTPSVRDIRAWALASPVLVILLVVSHGRPRR